MSLFRKLQFILIILSVLLGLWNYLWRESLTLPLFSNLSSLVVYIIAGVILVVTLMIRFSKDHD